IERIRLCLTDDAETNCRLAVGPDRRAFDIRPKRDGSNIADLRASVDVDVLEILRLFQIGRGTDNDGLIGATQRTGRGVQPHGRKRRRNIRNGQTIARKARLIDIDAEYLVAVTVDLDVSHARNRGEDIL